MECHIATSRADEVEATSQVTPSQRMTHLSLIENLVQLLGVADQVIGDAQDVAIERLDFGKKTAQCRGCGACRTEAS